MIGHLPGGRVTQDRLSDKERKPHLTAVSNVVVRSPMLNRSVHRAAHSLCHGLTNLIATRPLAAVILVLMFTIPTITDALAAESLAFDASRVTWTQARYKASKMFVESKTTVDLKTIPVGEAASTLIASGQAKDLKPTGSESLWMKLHAKFWGRNVVTRSWIEPDSAQALQRLTTESEERQRYKLYRFTDAGVFRLRKKPQGNEQDLSAEKWTDVSERLLRYPESGGNRPVVTLPIGIFYVLATAELNAPGDRVEIPVFSTKHFNLVTITVEGTTRFKADYKETSASGRNNKVKGRVDALRLSLKPKVMGTGEIDFYFLGLRGNVEVILDKKRRVPLQLIGEAKKVGDLEINLDRLMLN